MDSTREELIRQVANEIWVEAGKPDGQADKHWAMAQERIVSAFSFACSIHSAHRTQQQRQFTMRTTDVFITPTFDLEPLSIEGSSGPASWDEGKRSTEQFLSVIEDYGLRSTIFVSFEALDQPAQVEMLLAAKKRGHELGGHMHPQKLAAYLGEDTVPHKDFGALTAEETRNAIVLLKDKFATALGFQMETFSGGTFSFNDHQFEILQELGVKHVRCSLPGRDAPKKAATWSKYADRWPHYANAANRHVRGDLDIIEVPHSVDSSVEHTSGAPPHQMTHFTDPRVDADWGKYNTNYATINANLVDQINAADPDVPCIVFVAHNDEDYSVGSRLGTNLRETIETAKRALAGKSLTAIPGTIGDIAAKQRGFEKTVDRTVHTHGGWMGKEEKK